MSDTEYFSIECGTCLAAGTTACGDCVVSHLLANDDGPIDYVTVPVEQPTTAQQRTVALFERAGLLDDPVRFVPIEEFAPAPPLVPAGRHGCARGMRP